MSNIIELFEYQFFTNAIFAAILASISCGIIGTYIVTNRIVFISGGITHASFGGVGIGYFLGLNPVVSAAIFGLFSALGIEYISKKADIREDSTIAILWSLGMAIGIIFIFITPGYAPNLISFLFGNILTVTISEVLVMLALCCVIAVFFTLFYRLILFVSFDEEYASTHNAPVGFIKYSLMALIAITIVLNIKVVGIILVLSLFTIPQASANLLTEKYHEIIFYSIGLGLIGSIGGLVISYLFNIPSGASIIFTLILIFIILKSVIGIRKLLVRNN